MAKLILILGDQLTASLSSLKSVSSEDTVIMMESRSETDHIQHHRRKIVFLFSAMRHFAEDLKKQCNVHYIKLDDPENKHDFLSNLKVFIKQGQYEKLILTEPSEYDLLAYFKNGLTSLRINFEILPDDRFLCTKAEFKKRINGRKKRQERTKRCKNKKKIVT